MSEARVCLLGNPNVGKTALFNALTGQRGRVGNYPGVTVECVGAPLRLGDDRTAELIDVPGCYSLCARSAEEQVALNAALGLGGFPKPDLVVQVLDAGQLLRNLYLTVQLAELGIPLVLALNLMDEAGDAAPDVAALTRQLGVPCVGTSARHGHGIEQLREAIAGALDERPLARVGVRYPDALRRDADRVADALPEAWQQGSVERRRALALWALMSLEDEDELTGMSPELRERVRDVRRDAGRDQDLEIVSARYSWLTELLARAGQGEVSGAAHPLTERVDRVLLHPVAGFAIFLVLMTLVFQALFTWSDPAISAVERGVQAVQQLVQGLLPETVMRALLVEGVLGGVGNVLVFLPQILLLFAIVGLMEDSGYMARVAYLMDRVMRALGLHGRAFVPMFSGFACAIPAVLATRTMERRRDRILTMLVVPLMSCSARLPIYTLVIAALFPPRLIGGVLPLQGLLMVAMYLFSTVIALVATAVLGRTIVKGKSVPLILELPPYRMPSWLAVARMMRDRSWEFVREAGTVILAFTVVLWGLLSFPKPPASVVETSAAPAALVAAPEALPAATVGPTTGAGHGAETAPPPDAASSPELEAEAERSPIAQSYGGRLGHALEPLLRPLGFDWKIGVGLIGAFAAREVFISTLGLVYGIGDADENTGTLREKLRAERGPDGRPLYRPLTGLSLMVFFAVACQCMSTVAVVYRESKSWRWPLLMVVYMNGLAWALCFALYQLGTKLGF